ISWWLAQAFATHSDTLLAPFVHNVLLRSVVGSVISGLIIMGGVGLALAARRLTHAVMSVVGVSGLVVLAVGFAFRDITENFIASVLLGLRRPFQIGDYVTIAGQAGAVKSLHARATVATEGIDRALREPPGILPDPTPRALVEALEPGGVRLRADFWTPTHNI